MLGALSSRFILHLLHMHIFPRTLAVQTQSTPSFSLSHSIISHFSSVQTSFHSTALLFWYSPVTPTHPLYSNTDFTALSSLCLFGFSHSRMRCSLTCPPPAPISMFVPVFTDSISEHNFRPKVCFGRVFILTAIKIISTLLPSVLCS